MKIRPDEFDDVALISDAGNIAAINEEWLSVALRQAAKQARALEILKAETPTRSMGDTTEFLAWFDSVLDEVTP